MTSNEPTRTVAPPPAPRLIASRPMYCRVIDLAAATADIRIVRLQMISGGPFRFSAGQYARVTFGEVRPRDYSMANPPSSPVLEFHIKIGGNGGASAYVATELRLGDGVWVEGPSGDAFLRSDHAGPSLLIAGGSGLAPMHSIVMQAAVLGFRHPMTLYYGTRGINDLYYIDRFRAVEAAHPAFRLVTVLTDPPPGGGFRSGTVVDAVRADVTDARGFRAYVAGPPPMVEAAVTLLRQRGIDAAHIHADAFHSASRQPAREQPAGG